MTTAIPTDDLEAVRVVVSALQSFQPPDQERIIRWAREKLGLTKAVPQAPGHNATDTPSDEPARQQATDIKSFVAAKAPQSDTQFAVVVAYFYRFEALPAERKDEISAPDLQEAARKAGRSRLHRPIDTLHNCVKAGLLDKGSTRGAFAVNTVGENLVAMALPEGKGSPAGRVRNQKKKLSPRKPAQKHKR